MAERKTCSTCKIDLPISCFRLRKKDKSYRASICNVCHVIQERDRRYKNTGKPFGVRYLAPKSPDTKKCSKCDSYLSLDCFSLNKSGAFGRNSICKECARQNSRTRYERLSKIHSANQVCSKACSKCGEIKDAHEFSPHKLTKSGLASQCRSCMAAGRQNASEARKAKARESVSAYNKSHPWVGINTRHKRRSAQKAGYVPKWAWDAIKTLCNNRCVMCGKLESLTVDHIIPLSKQGDHSILNIQPLCKSCNCKKSSKVWDGRNFSIRSLNDLRDLVAAL